eukprot:TRINITY_DN10506_c0_g1_i1.p1 TRINITY_DN10506_c0_g1~~TRINITY_DN10506_c0_g1_i1.p1  ORF type:complete len:558 (+),score=125.40 TRINITY_DN10506_c0_g1_i1:70-1743(+)
MASDNGECFAMMLSAEVWHRIMLYLHPRDVAALAQVNKQFASYVQDPSFWSAKLRNDYLRHPRGSSIHVPSCASTKQAYELAHGRRQLKRVNWHGLRGSKSLSIPAEGHAMAVMDNRYLVILGGYTNRGILQHLDVYDCQHLDRPVRLSAKVWPEDDEQKPAAFTNTTLELLGGRDVYGHTLTYLGDGKFLRYGGCMHGGYYGAVADPMLLEMKVQSSVSDPDSPPEVLVRPTELSEHVGLHFGPSCYHGVYPWTKHPNLYVFFGGLVEDTPHAKLEILNVKTWDWLELELQANDDGTVPSGRYGFSGGIVGDRLYILGGCTGGDIRRDGQDCRDVWCADLSQINPDEGGSYTWRSLGSTPDDGWGRETCSVVYGEKIVTFGGSTNSMQADEVTNAVAWFDAATETFGTPDMYGQPRDMHRPTLSAEMIDACKHFSRWPKPTMLLFHVLIQDHVMIYGGWTLRGLLSGPSLMSLGPYIEPAVPGIERSVSRDVQASSHPAAAQDHGMLKLDSQIEEGTNHSAYMGGGFGGLLRMMLMAQMQAEADDDDDDDDPDYEP